MKEGRRKKEVNGELINSVLLVLERPIGTGPKASGKVLELK